MQYDVLIKHKPGILNKADALSRRPDYPHKPDDPAETVFPLSMFANTATIDITLPAIIAAQETALPYLETLQTKYHLTVLNHLWFYATTRLVVPDDNNLRRGVISLFHDSTTAGHPGTRRTKTAVEKDFWWLSLNKDVQAYVKGCATCQSTKPRTN